MKRLALAVLAWSSFASGPALAQTQVTVAQNSNWVALVSPDSIKRDAENPDAIWADTRLASKAGFFLPTTQKGSRYAAVDMRIRVECDPLKVYEVDTVFRERSGSTVEEYYRGPSGGILTNVPPNSLLAVTAQYICRNAPPRPRKNETAAVPPPPPAREASQAQPAKPSPVRRSGTGFVVSASGHVLTNNHVTRDCSVVQLLSSDGQTADGRIIARDDRNDLALIHSSSNRWPTASFRASPIRSGEGVIALGYPLRGLLATDVNVSIGIVSAMAGLLNDTSQLQISAPVQPGNSGGPLLDNLGAVSGVVVAKLDAIAVAKVTGDIPQNISFAIKGEVAQSFLRASGVNPKLAAASSQKVPSTADVVEHGRTFTLLVECETVRPDPGSVQSTASSETRRAPTEPETVKVIGNAAWCAMETSPAVARCYHDSYLDCRNFLSSRWEIDCVPRSRVTASP